MNALHHAETTMTPDEAEAIVRRHLERESTATEGPRVADLAEALRITPEEVGRLLAEVRSEPLPKPKRQVMRRERRLWALTGLAALGIGLAALGVGDLVGAPRLILGRRSRLHPVSSRTSPAEFGATGEGAYELFLDGEPIGNSKYVGGVNGALQDGLFDWVEGSLPTPKTRAVSLQEDQASRRALQSGHWDGVVGVRFASLEIRKGDADRGWLRWAGETGSVPLYDGDDALIAEAVKNERDRRVTATLQAAIDGLPVSG